MKRYVKIRLSNCIDGKPMPPMDERYAERVWVEIPYEGAPQGTLANQPVSGPYSKGDSISFDQWDVEVGDDPELTDDLAQHDA